MKGVKVYITISLIALFGTSLWVSCVKHRHNINISVSEREDEYDFIAKYDPAKTARVNDFINDQLKPDVNIGSRESDLTVTLRDHSRFNLHSYPGELEIRMNRNENPPGGYTRIKAICDGIKNRVLTH